MEVTKTNKLSSLEDVNKLIQYVGLNIIKSTIKTQFVYQLFSPFACWGSYSS